MASEEANEASLAALCARASAPLPSSLALTIARRPETPPSALEALWSSALFSQLEWLRLVETRWSFGGLGPWLDAFERSASLVRGEFEALDGYRLVATREEEHWSLAFTVLANPGKRFLAHTLEAALAGLDPSRIARVRLATKEGSSLLGEHWQMRELCAGFARVEYPPVRKPYLPLVPPFPPVQTGDPARDALVATAHHDPDSIRALLARPDEALDRSLLDRLRACVNGVGNVAWSESLAPKAARRKAVHEYDAYRSVHGERAFIAGLGRRLRLAHVGPAVAGPHREEPPGAEVSRRTQGAPRAIPGLTRAE